MVKSLLDKNSPVESMSLMGGKGQNLFLMEGQGVTVPSWCCVPSDVYTENFESIKSEVLDILKEVDLTNLEKIKTISLEIENLFLKLEVKKELLNALKSKFDGVKYFAVRSSAVGEDGLDNSFAGQLSTYLFVKPESIAEKIKKCWASGFSERVIQYNALNNRDYESLKVAVIIQEMIDSEKSGVLFTVNPLMGKDFYNQAVITAGYATKHHCNFIIRTLSRDT